MTETALSAAMGLLFAAGVAVVVDAPGRILLGLGAALFLAQTARDLVLRPRLSAGPDGVRVRRVAGGVHLPWGPLRIGVRETRRLGLRTPTLELDTASGPDDEGVLVVLGRRDLGAEPAAVARRLRELDPRA
ncbi:PH domain-containing protein [Blastococcus sp. TF02-9]|uniref:PH domain-containing protein n=1 Tax=Blastococcus sp. TF02-09 TaxID=2250576 RepID=UPI001F3FF581|nr:PH domain-containing protein [Blastococcus sp. TF02-9]